MYNPYLSLWDLWNIAKLPHSTKPGWCPLVPQTMGMGTAHALLFSTRQSLADTTTVCEYSSTLKEDWNLSNF